MAQEQVNPPEIFLYVNVILRQRCWEGNPEAEQTLDVSVQYHVELSDKAKVFCPSYSSCLTAREAVCYFYCLYERYGICSPLCAHNWK